MSTTWLSVAKWAGFRAGEGRQMLKVRPAPLLFHKPSRPTMHGVGVGAGRQSRERVKSMAGNRRAMACMPGQSALARPSI